MSIAHKIICYVREAVTLLTEELYEIVQLKDRLLMKINVYYKQVITLLDAYIYKFIKDVKDSINLAEQLRITSSIKLLESTVLNDARKYFIKYFPKEVIILVDSFIAMLSEEAPHDSIDLQELLHLKTVLEIEKSITLYDSYSKTTLCTTRFPFCFPAKFVG